MFTYSFKLKNLDCANCAAKVESAIKKLDGVKDCNISFFTLKMQLQLESELSDEFLQKITKTAQKIERHLIIE